MEWIPVITVVGIGVLFFGGKKFAPKIIGQGKAGANAWIDEAKKAYDEVKSEEKINGEERG